jgi:hypothetical protein
MLKVLIVFGIKLVKKKHATMPLLHIILMLYVLYIYQHAQSIIQTMDVKIEYVPMPHL